MRNSINYITKIKFLLCFKLAFNTTIIKSNILSSFKGASLVFFNFKVIILKLNI
ncbi:uncharacterized protein K460DRAFT_423888 [Cucurbitaria berberidis CBS 394.84]|uniref:Uncharacterized protein n=1 Tax=Cucurbitaria berberidis CBS 394.84 TaxID=1168544 RepID=A0A9P4GU09_9PLEO|nr:uncharacterized protein K460DRAFT_423888 [Cucurbitaria berberidis CBS 394.84]KAF1851274.1 hypothetical protein K460DRAFT_423888 [Cucurbitaria berberidis CBS 394.84]